MQFVLPRPVDSNANSNSRFLVERSLGEEFAELLGMRAQLFELRAVSWRQAVAVHVRNAMSLVSGKNAAQRVGGLFEVAFALEDDSKEPSEAARILLSHKTGIVSAPEAREHCPHLCRVAGVDQADVATNALFEASEAGQCDSIRPLVALGANPGATNDKGRTPLHVAAQQGSVECVRALLEVKANPQATDAKQRLPCQVAAKHQHHRVVRLLGEAAPLPAELLELYQPASVTRFFIVVMISACLLAACLVGFLAPFLEHEIGEGQPLSDTFEFVGFGTCTNEHHSYGFRRSSSENSVQDCLVRTMASHGVGATVELRPSGGVECTIMLGPEEAPTYWSPPSKTRVSFAATHVFQEEQSTNRICFGRKRVGSRIPISYSYKLFGAAPYGNCTNATDCGYAQTKAGKDCDAQLMTATAGVFDCQDGTSCGGGNESCCNDHGGVLHCPPDRPVMCNNCSERCCHESAFGCPDWKIKTCGTPFLVCADYDTRCPSNVAAVGPALCSMRFEPLYYISLMCPAACDMCPGSARAEHDSRGATLLLMDGQASPDGRGCISLGDGVLIQLYEPRVVDRVRLRVYGSEVPIVEFGNDTVRSPAAKLEPGTAEGEWWAVAPGGCRDLLAMWTVARVCEVELYGDSCGGNFSTAGSCLPPNRIKIPSAGLCTAAEREMKALEAGAVARMTSAPAFSWEEWLLTAAPAMDLSASSDCAGPLVRGGAGWDLIPTCLNVPRRSQVKVAEGVAGLCEDSWPVVAFQSKSVEDCEAMLFKHAAPMLSVRATWVGAVDDTEVFWCLLHVADIGVSLDDTAPEPFYVTPSSGVPTGASLGLSLDELYPGVLGPAPKGTVELLGGTCYEVAEGLDAIPQCKRVCEELSECAATAVDPAAPRICCFWSSIIGMSLGLASSFLSLRNPSARAYLSPASICLEANFLPEPPEESALFRLSLTGACPAGTNGDMSLAECGRAGYELGLGRATAEAVMTPSQPGGCWLVEHLIYNRAKATEGSWETG
eukprot:Hpha_TRINITY_DN18405_c0_g1::TRINITY_DN18405_c0_g1_i1::g.165311::m.165311